MENFWTDPSFWILILAGIGGFFMAFNNGANDVSNAFASAVGSKAIGMRSALILAGIFTFIGAVFFGAKVAVKLVEGLVEVTQFENPQDYALAMVSVLFAAGLFILGSTFFGLPVSSTHSIVGSFTGINIAVIGWGAIKWSMLGYIALSWVMSPIIAGGISWLILGLIEGWWWQLKKRYFRQWVAMFLGIVVSGISFLLFTQAWNKSLLYLKFWHISIISLVAGLLTYMSIHLFSKFRKKSLSKQQVFERLQIGTACAVAFGNGANDVSNSISPLLAVYWVLCLGGFPGSIEAAQIPQWILWIGGAGILAGILFLGHRVMDTLGRKITVLTPQRGFGIDFAVATVVIMASSLGLPISTTHAATGSIIGAGLRSGIGSISIGILAKIFIAWIFTVPLAAILTIAIYHLILFTLGCF